MRKEKTRGSRPVKMERLARPQTLLSQTEQVLRDAIAKGRFSGNRLPTAAELGEELGVSRETVRKAQETLQRDGLLVKYRRRGTLLEPPAMKWKARAEKSTLLGYLQADYPSPHGDEAVTRSTSGLMLQGAMREAGRAGHQLVVRHAPYTEMDQVIEQVCRATTLRGVIFASFGEDKLVRKALGYGLPTVLLDHDLHLPAVSSVREDSFQGARVAVEHLASLGHRRIAYAHWHLSDLNPWRMEGFRRGLRDAGLARRRVCELAAEITREGAEALVGQLLALDPPPTALLCFNNTLAHLVIDELRRRKVRVPEDLSVMGGGGETVAGLTCHQADWFSMGRAAVEVLLRTISSRGKLAPRHRMFPYEVSPGRTTAPPVRPS